MLLLGDAQVSRTPVILLLLLLLLLLLVVVSWVHGVCLWHAQVHAGRVDQVCLVEVCRWVHGGSGGHPWRHGRLWRGGHRWHLRAMMVGVGVVVW